MFEKKMDALFSLWDNGLCPGGQVIVRKKGKIIYKQNYGYANIEHEIPVRDETIFHVASVSKQITVMCVLLLQEDGLLCIDDDIRKYIPDLIHFKEDVTIRNMMNNVSGIRDQWELLELSGVRIVDTITQKDAISIISKQKELNFEPLTNYLYSNSNFTLLAEIVERISGKSFNDFARERIFKPLGMANTCFKEHYSDIIKNSASSYEVKGKNELVHSVLNYATYGATSLNTTAVDFLKWLDNYKDPKICKKETLDVMFTNPTLKNGKESEYACGLFSGYYKGHPYIEHSGADAGFRSKVIHYIEDDVDIIVFSNTTNLPIGEIVNKISDTIFNIEEEDDKEVPSFYVEDFNFEEIEGYYLVHIPNQIIHAVEIVVKDKVPYVIDTYGLNPLKHINGNHYKYMNMDLYLGNQCGTRLKGKYVHIKKLNPFKVNQEMASKYLGCYRSDELETEYKIVYEDGFLYLLHCRNGKHKLYHISGNQFVCGNISTHLLEFITDGFFISGNRVKMLKLVRDKND